MTEAEVLQCEAEYLRRAASIARRFSGKLEVTAMSGKTALMMLVDALELQADAADARRIEIEGKGK